MVENHAMLLTMGKVFLQQTGDSRLLPGQHMLMEFANEGVSIDNFQSKLDLKGAMSDKLAAMLLKK